MKTFLCFLLFGCSFSFTKPVELPTKAAGNPLLTLIADIPSGPSVAGVFDGRTPCQEVARAMSHAVEPECVKLKWRLILHQNPQTQAPTTYRLEGTLYRQRVREGKWGWVTDDKMYPDAVIYQLDPDHPDQSLYLLKGDDNVLFFLDKNHRLLIGNADYGYTLNRVSR